MELPACDLLYADACALAAHSLKNAQIITVPLTWNSLPPAGLSCDSLSLSLSLSLLSNQDLKLICFLLLSANYSTYLFHQRLCRHLTALQHYINLVFLLLLLLILQSGLLLEQSSRTCLPHLQPSKCCRHWTCVTSPKSQALSLICQPRREILPPSNQNCYNVEC